jgi:DNA-binding GntR family transcriptional regulator
VEELAPEDLAQLEESLKAMKAAAGRRDSLGFLEADKDFHMVAVHRAGNLHLQAIMENVRNHISIFGLKALAHPGRFQEVIREHTAILEALRQKDRKKAVQAMADHLATTQSYLLGTAAG